MKFAHMGDCHLGGWKQPALKELNLLSFRKAVDICIKENVEFILITGDLFDSPYPSIDTLKEVFQEFKMINDKKIPVFLIAGSHDYSVSGKTFLEVLEKAGFCRNVALYEEKNDKLYLLPTVWQNVALYGYPGKKGGLEVAEIERLALQDSPGLFKILMLHTTLKDAIGFLPVKAVDQDKLPKVDYLALSHLHINYQKQNRAYSGPTFPNNLQELEELKGGSFYIFDNGKLKREEIRLKEIFSLNFEVKDAFTAADSILSALSEQDLKNKVVILKLYGILKKGRISDIEFSKIEEFVRKKEAFVFLKTSSRLHMPELDIGVEITDTVNLEEQIIKKFEEKHPSKYNSGMAELIKILQSEKLDDEKSAIFDERILSDAKKVLALA